MTVGASGAASSFGSIVTANGGSRSFSAYISAGAVISQAFDVMDFAKGLIGIQPATISPFAANGAGAGAIPNSSASRTGNSGAVVITWDI